jgi:hypothetical protein
MKQNTPDSKFKHSVLHILPSILLSPSMQTFRSGEASYEASPEDDLIGSKLVVIWYVRYHQWFNNILL